MAYKIKVRCVMVQKEPYGAVRFYLSNELIISYYPVDREEAKGFEINKEYEIIIKESEAQNEN